METNKRVKLVLGTMTFGESVFGEDVDHIISAFLDAGYDELDTAYVYNDGRCEALIGEALDRLGRDVIRISTKVNPRITGRLDGNAARTQLNESLQRLGTDHVDTFYLHFPDPNTPLDSVLEACAELHGQGKFLELGLSNFPAWLVADVYHRCAREGWMLPTVYEGIYNPMTRKAEIELDGALDYFGLRFYAYNPLAGGLLTGRYHHYEEAPTDGRFTHRPNYQKRYWKPALFQAMEDLRSQCDAHGVSMVEAVYRWLSWHSMLKGVRGDAILIGASKLEHLKQNLASAQAGTLPETLASAIDGLWDTCKGESSEYFRFYGSAMN